MNRQNVATGSVPDNVKGGKGKPQEVPIPQMQQVVTFPVMEPSISIGMTLTVECKDGFLTIPDVHFTGMKVGAYGSGAFKSNRELDDIYSTLGWYSAHGKGVLSLDSRSARLDDSNILTPVKLFGDGSFIDTHEQVAGVKGKGYYVIRPVTRGKNNDFSRPMPYERITVPDDIADLNQRANRPLSENFYMRFILIDM